MSKTAFYFKTQDEFNDLFYYILAIDNVATKHLHLHGQIIQTKSRYLNDPRADHNPRQIFIPKTKATSKKYIGILLGNKHHMKRAGIDPIEILKKFSLERVQPSDHLPKYTGETSEGCTHIKGYEQFKKLTSVFNKQFGHGNWKIRGPKRLQKKLMAISADVGTFGGAAARNQYPNGIKVKIVVNKPNIDINKYIFKIALMTS